MRKISLFIITVIFVIMLGCYQKHPKSFKENKKEKTDEVDSTNDISYFHETTNRDMHNRAFVESIQAYEYLEANPDKKNVLVDYKGKSLVFNIEIKDSIIIGCDADVFTFDSVGRLLSCKHSSEEALSRLFLNLNIKELGFVDTLGSRYLDFRIEVE